MHRPYDRTVTGSDTSLSFPRHSARTQRFSLGRPRSFSVGADGERVVFLRSRGGQDLVTCLWVLDVGTGEERLVADPLALGVDGGDLPAAERARRERAREMAGGITTYAVDDRATVATFMLGGSLGLADLRAGSSRLLDVPSPVADPQPSPDGSGRIAYVREGIVVVCDGSGSVLQEISGPAGTTAGLADFIAAEELGRMRGLWWAPDARALLVAVVDDSPVQRWWIADPAHPDRPAAQHPYPAAGTPNALVSLLLAPLGGQPQPVSGWDSVRYPYLASVGWSPAGLILQVLSRDQRSSQVLRVDTETAVAQQISATSSDRFLDLIPGIPRLLDDGRLLTAHEDPANDTRRIAIDGIPISPGYLHVSGVRHAGDGVVLVIATEDDPTVRHVYAVPLDGGPAQRLSNEPGVHDAVVGGKVVVSVSGSLDRPGTEATVRADGAAVRIDSFADTPPLVPRVRIVRGGRSDLRVGIVLPRAHVVGTALPVLMDPYGGPHHAEVLATQGMWLEPQWWADQGFAVVVADGRGTPGRSVSWEKAIAGDLASAPLADQVEALELAAAHEPDLDISRVAIRGWSFGGYLAALAVLRRPDVFHAAIAGAPVTDWSLYDTAYTERYLGTDPAAADAAAYARSSLIADAPALSRPLLLIHGLADDNVVAAHTLRLSAALLASGRPHDVLPITGATHMAAAEEVAENLLLLQLTWLRRALAIG
jgi:dipeptidyl-peptidase-4